MTQEALQQLLDIETLKKLKYRYFRLLDAQDWSAFEALFTDDLEMNFSFPDAQFYPPDAVITPEGWARVDRDGLLNWVRSVSEGFTTVHFAHMPDIEFTGPDTATGNWSMTDFSRWDASGDPTWYRSYGGHLEDYVRTPDGWRIERSVFTRHDFDVFDAPDSLAWNIGG
jgi:hypothetical protein